MDSAPNWFTAEGSTRDYGLQRRSVSVRWFVCLLVMGSFVAGCTGSQTARRSADEWYDLGQSQLARKRYTKAEEAFSKFLEQYPQDRRRPEALLGLAEALYADERYEEAKFQYRRFLELYPTHSEADKAQFNIAMSAFHRMKTIDRDQTTTHEALQEFQRLVQAYPRSQYVDAAREKIAACRERLAAYELYVGRFYYRQEAYPSAIGRFAGLLRMYPEVSFADEVLFLLGEAYRRNDEPQQAANSFDTLVRRFPDSRYANQARARLASLR
ncbi:MAG TPA: outer membrane protein assembly factor BamD [Alphaproteobacteria bacterium]|nr:outer membrane protein assembly factor BamD [Alphaproteobacteria bacterium]